MQGAQVRKVSPPIVIPFDRPLLSPKSWGLLHPGILATVTMDTPGYGDVSLLPITQFYVGALGLLEYVRGAAPALHAADRLPLV